MNLQIFCQKKLRYLSVLLVLTVILFSTACDVPDISEFTKQSAEMTSGIRTGIKDAGGLVQDLAKELDHAKEIAENNDQLRSTDKTKAELKTAITDAATAKKNADDYEPALEPSLKTLDGLDAYLDALNALAQANKKSGDNAKAAVAAVSNLVTSVAAFPIFQAQSAVKIPDSAIKIATGLVALEEQFRTAKSFKKQVTIAADIVEGAYDPVTTTSKVNGEIKSTTVLIKRCSSDPKSVKYAKTGIEMEGQKLATEIKGINVNKSLSDEAKKSKIKDAHATYDKSIKDTYGCGVIDLLKFTLGDLKVISQQASEKKFNNYHTQNKQVIEYHDAIIKNYTRDQRDLESILTFKNLDFIFRENNGPNKPTIDQMKLLRSQLEFAFRFDAQLENTLKDMLQNCNTVTDPNRCGKMSNFLTIQPDYILAYISVLQWATTTNIIEKVLDARASTLYDQSKSYADQLAWINSEYTTVTADEKAIKDKEIQLSKLFDTGNEALDAWIESHANLRVALNTKKPLSVARLASKAKEIWALFNPQK